MCVALLVVLELVVEVLDVDLRGDLIKQTFEQWQVYLTLLVELFVRPMRHA